MSKRRASKPATAEQLARSTRSEVAVAAFLRTGAGKHGAQGAARHRADRRDSRLTLRRGDWD